MKLRSVLSLVGVFAVVGLIACSSDSSSSSSDSCDDAATVAKGCGTSDGGSGVTITFDAAKCKQSDQGKAAAKCIVDNKSKCDCVLKCSLNGSCS